MSSINTPIIQKRDDVMGYDTDKIKDKNLRKQMILDMMKHPSYTPLKIKEIITMLQVPPSDRTELENILVS